MATPAESEELNGGVANNVALGAMGELLPKRLGVNSVYELAPEGAKVMVLGEPLKACAQRLVLPKARLKDGGVVTETCAMVVLVQEVGAVTMTV